MGDQRKSKPTGLLKGLLMAFGLTAAMLALAFIYVAPYVFTFKGETLPFQKLAREFCEDLLAERYSTAYAKLSPDLRSGLSESMFRNTVRENGPIQAMRGVSFHTNTPDAGSASLEGVLRTIGKRIPIRFQFVAMGEGWAIDGIFIRDRSVFPPPGAKPEEIPAEVPTLP